MPDAIQRVKQIMADVPASPTTVTPRRFRDDGSTQANTTSERSRVARLRADTPLRLLDGPDHPIKVAIPAYESYSTDGTGGNTETFNLSNNVIDTPVTAAVDVWLDGTHYGQPDSVDYANNTIDVTDPGTNSTVHVYYIVDETASLELVKSTPSANADATQGLYDAPLRLVHQTDQHEQPETLRLNETPLQEWVAEDMAVDVYVDAGYTVRLEESTDGTHATNALLSLPVIEGQDTAPDLAELVRDDMRR